MRKNKIILLGLVLVLASVTFPACENAHSDIDITLQTDYSQIVEAIDGVDQSLTEKLGLIEAAVAGGFADNVAAQQLVQKAVASLSGSLAEKLAAVETAVKGGTSSLERKLGLIEAAVTQGFVDGKAQQALIRSAVETLSGTADEKLAQVEGAVKNQTGSLETKLALIETALKEGLAGGETEQVLLQEALKALEGTLDEQLQAIAAAMGSQAASLAAKLDLVAAALESGLTEAGDALALLRQAVEALDGTAAEKLAAVDTAVQRQTAALETKLGLIEAAVKSGFADDKAEQALLQQAVKTLGGTTEARLAAISNAIGNQGTTLSDKLDLIRVAVASGLVNDADGKQDLILQAIKALAGTVSEKLAAIDTALLRQTDSLATKLGLIVAELEGGLADEATALGQLGAAVTTLAATLDDPQAAYSVAAAIDSINTRLSAEGAIGKVLSDLVVAVQGLNYTEALTLLKQAVEDLAAMMQPVVPMINGHEYVDLDLPSGLKWATRNIGATMPEGYGDFFAWCETAPKADDDYSWSTLQYCKDNTGDTFSKYVLSDQTRYWGGEGSTPDNKTVLEAVDDAATANWGAPWRMPSGMEFKELLDYCNTVWTTQNGVNGYLFTSKKNGATLFLPAAGGRVTSSDGSYGLYWSSSLHWYSSYDAWALRFYFFKVGIERYSRFYGLSVRPVTDK